jgi:RNA polymerase sigma-70 factor (ECF subfamily)
MQDESELIRRSAEGDLDAFEELILLKRDRVYRTAYQILRNSEDSRDVAQLVFVRLWRVIRRYRPERKFDTWLYRITINLALDQKRRMGPAGRTVPLEAVGDPVAGPAGAATSGTAGGSIQSALVEGRANPEGLFEREELRRVYTSIASGLTERQRLVFSMREVEGLSAEEIAKSLGVTSSTVRNTHFQARAVLREALRRKFPEYFPRGTRPRPGKKSGEAE